MPNAVFCNKSLTSTRPRLACIGSLCQTIAKRGLLQRPCLLFPSPQTTAFGMYWHFMDAKQMPNAVFYNSSPQLPHDRVWHVLAAYAKQMPNAVFYNLPARPLPTRPRLACIGTLWPNKCQTRSFIPCLSFLSSHDRVWHVLVVYAKRSLLYRLPPYDL